MSVASKQGVILSKKLLQFITALMWCFCVLLVACFSSIALADLPQIQQQIKQQESQIIEKKREQNQLQASLKSQELQLSQVITDLKQTEKDLTEIKSTLRESQQRLNELTKREAEQKQYLTKQLEQLHKKQHESSLGEQIMNGNVQQEERMKAYAKQLNLLRLQALNELQQTRYQIEQQSAAIKEQQKQQQAILNQQKIKQQDLQKVRTQREKTLVAINQDLQKAENKLSVLRANENALKQEINQAEKRERERDLAEKQAFEQKKQSEEKRSNKPYQPTEKEKRLMRTAGGLGKPSKQYNKPVNGKILHSYGSVQAGELRWKGVVIQAPQGSSVKAIANGRVILANWLQGYGQVVVIDHGKGDMSLYGYNQRVMVRSGDLVNAGQAIAEVGNSGGQKQSALYFEIRRQGNAVNPMGWLK